MALQWWEDELVAAGSAFAMAIFSLGFSGLFRAMWIVPIHIGGLVALPSSVVMPWEIKKSIKNDKYKAHAKLMHPR